MLRDSAPYKFTIDVRNYIGPCSSFEHLGCRSPLQPIDTSCHNSFRPSAAFLAWAASGFLS